MYFVWGEGSKKNRKALLTNLIPMRPKARGLTLTGVLNSFTGWEWHIRRDFYCNRRSVLFALTERDAWSGRGCSAASFCHFQLLVYYSINVFNGTSSLKLGMAGRVIPTNGTMPCRLPAPPPRPPSRPLLSHALLLVSFSLGTQNLLDSI